MIGASFNAPKSVNKIYNKEKTRTYPSRFPPLHGIEKRAGVHVMQVNNISIFLNAYRQFKVSNEKKVRMIERLSSGKRINRAADDPTGLAISEKMRGQIHGLNQAYRNVLDGYSLLQTADGALEEGHAILQRMREIAVQAGNDTYTKADRDVLQEELSQLTSELNRIFYHTEYNTKNLLIGANTSIHLHGSIHIVYMKVYESDPSVQGAVGQFQLIQHSQAAPPFLTVDYTVQQQSVKATPSQVGIEFNSLLDIDLESSIFVNGFQFKIRSMPDNSLGTENYWEVNNRLTGKYTAEEFFTAFQAAKAAPANTGALDDITAELRTEKVGLLNVYTVVLTYAGGNNSIPVYTESNGIRTSSNLNDPVGDANTLSELITLRPSVDTFVDGVEEQRGIYTFSVNENFSTGSLITIGDVTFSAVPYAPTEAGQFQIGATAEETMGHLLQATLADPTLGARFEDNGSSGKTISLIEKSGQSTGEDVPAPVVIQASDEIPGRYAFTITNNFRDKEKIVVAGQTYTFRLDGAAGTVKIGNTTAETAQYLLAALLTNPRFEDDGSTNAMIAIKERPGQVTGVDIEAPVVLAAPPQMSSVVFKMESPLAEKEVLNIFGIVFEATKDGNVTEEGNIALDLNVYQTTTEQATFITNYLNTIEGLHAEQYEDIISIDIDSSNSSTISSPYVDEAERQPFEAILQVGANTGQTMTIEIDDMRAIPLRVSIPNPDWNVYTKDGTKIHYVSTPNVTRDYGTYYTEYSLDISSAKTSSVAITAIDEAIHQLSHERGKIGAYTNRLGQTMNYLENTSEKLQAAESRIRDADMAKEMMGLMRENILTHMHETLLAQANQTNENTLYLLRDMIDWS